MKRILAALCPHLLKYRILAVTVTEARVHCVTLLEPCWNVVIDMPRQAKQGLSLTQSHLIRPAKFAVL